MTLVFESILPIFAIIMLGFALRKCNFVPGEHWRIIEELCFWLFFPALLAETLIKADLASIELGPFTFTLLATITSVGTLALALWPLLKKNWGTKRSQFSTIFQTTTRWHGFIALAIVLKLYSSDGGALIAVALAVLVPILQISSILVLLAFSSHQRIDLWQVLKTLLTNPIIWGVITGLSINLIKIPVYEPIMTILDLLGRAALGTSLLAIGAGLSMRAALKPSRELWVGLIGKLVATPIIMAGWAIFFEVSSLAFSILMICAAVPTAMNGYLLAKKMGGDAQLYAAISTVQTVLSFMTIPLVLWLAKTYAGAL